MPGCSSQCKHPGQGQAHTVFFSTSSCSKYRDISQCQGWGVGGTHGHKGLRPPALGKEEHPSPGRETKHFPGWSFPHSDFGFRRPTAQVSLPDPSSQRLPSPSCGPGEAPRLKQVGSLRSCWAPHLLWLSQVFFLPHHPSIRILLPLLPPPLCVGSFRSRCSNAPAAASPLPAAALPPGQATPDLQTQSGLFSHGSSPAARPSSDPRCHHAFPSPDQGLQTLQDPARPPRSHTCTLPGHPRRARGLEQQLVVGRETSLSELLIPVSNASLDIQ